MTPEQIRTAVLDALAEVAPDAQLDSVDPTTSLQEQFDLDSFDFLNLVVALSERLGVEVPEQDYGELATLDACVAHLTRALDSVRTG
jgi:acyl carrier protein